MLSKEEYNKCTVVFQLQPDSFFSDTCLIPQGLICKEGKNYYLFFDGSFLEAPSSTCINKFALIKDEIELKCSSAMTRHLVRIHNNHTSYLEKQILLFDGDLSGEFRHVKPTPRQPHLTPTPLVRLFVRLSVLHSAQTSANATSKCFINLAIKSRVISILPRSDQNYAKHSALIGLIKLSEDVEKFPYLLAQSTKGKQKKSYSHTESRDRP